METNYIKVIHSTNKVDIYLRKDDELAEEIYLMNKNLFPKAKIIKKVIRINKELIED